MKKFFVKFLCRLFAFMGRHGLMVAAVVMLATDKFAPAVGMFLAAFYFKADDIVDELQALRAADEPATVNIDNAIVINKETQQ